MGVEVLGRQMMTDMAINGLEDTIGRFYGTYMGLVKDNRDPKFQGRIRVVSSVFPLSDQQLDDDKDGKDLWVPPKSLFVGKDIGMFFPPEIGSYVFIIFVNGDPLRPFYDGGSWTADERSPAPTQTLIPTKRGIITKTGYELIFSELEEKDGGDKEPYFLIKTPKGHVLRLIDTDDKESVQLSDSLGNIILTNKDGISITSMKDEKITIKENVTVSIGKDEKIEIGGNQSIKITGNQTIEVTGNCNIKVSGNVSVEGTKITVKGTTVKITGGMATIGGTVAPTGKGALCGLPVCVFSGAPHVGDTASGT